MSSGWWTKNGGRERAASASGWDLTWGGVIPVIRIRHGSGEWGVIRTLGAMALVLWGLSTGLDGVGLGHSTLSLLLNTWWPAPFMVYGLVGIALDRTVGFGAHTGLFLAVLVVSGVILVSHLALSGINVGDLVWAAILVVLGLLALKPARRWW